MALLIIEGGKLKKTRLSRDWVWSFGGQNDWFLDPSNWFPGGVNQVIMIMIAVF